MKKILFLFSFKVLGLLTLTFSSSAVAGNFHYQIDVMSQLITNQNGKLGAVQMSWLYDEKISHILLQDEDLTATKRKESLNTVGNLIMTDLRSLNYFTKLQSNGQLMKINKVDSFSVELIDDKYLRLVFTLPLTQPFNTDNAKISISLADPNGAAMLFYDSAERITLGDSAQAQCNINLIKFDEFDHGKAAQRVDIICK